jgi:hypothetical protein
LQISKDRVQRGPRLQKVEIYLLADQVDLSTWQPLLNGNQPKPLQDRFDDHDLEDNVLNSEESGME